MHSTSLRRLVAPRCTARAAASVIPSRVVTTSPARLALAGSGFSPATRPLVALDGERGLPRCVPRPVAPAPAPVAPAKAEPVVINQKLFDYLQANPEVKTVQDLVNKTYPKGTYDQTCRELGLEPWDIARYRSAALMDFAVRQPRGDGSAPTTAADANRFFITQYQDDTYNRESPNSWSNNCGPTSLAMVLDVNGKRPEGLTDEQAIDYARGLMYPDYATKSVTLPDGSTVKLFDSDKMLTNMTAMTRGAAGAGLSGAQHQTGWADFDAALNAGKALVVEGNISGAWRTVFANHKAEAPGNYQGGGNGHFLAVLGRTDDGKYLVADPMFTGGTVAMSRDELAVFFAQMGGKPSFMTP